MFGKTSVSPYLCYMKNYLIKKEIEKLGWQVRQAGNGEYYVKSTHFFAKSKSMAKLAVLINGQKPF